MHSQEFSLAMKHAGNLVVAYVNCIEDVFHTHTAVVVSSVSCHVMSCHAMSCHVIVALSAQLAMHLCGLHPQKAAGKALANLAILAFLLWLHMWVVELFQQTGTHRHHPTTGGGRKRRWC